MIEKDEKESKTWNLDKGAAQWTGYITAIRAEAQRKGVTRFLDRANPPQAIVHPFPEMLQPRPEGFTDIAWTKFRMEFYQKKLHTWTKDKEHDDNQFEDASAVIYDALWPEGKLQVNGILREPIPSVRFLALFDKIEQEWKPVGQYRLAELTSEFNQLTELNCGGVLHFFRRIEEVCDAIRILDVTKVPGDMAKKLVLVTGISCMFFKQQLMTHMSDEQWTYAHAEEVFRQQIRVDAKLDVNATHDLGVINVDHVCFNCGQEQEKGGHMAFNCPVLKCGRCNKTFHNGEPRHTSSNCPNQNFPNRNLATQIANRGGRGGGRGRGNNGGRGRGGNGNGRGRGGNGKGRGRGGNGGGRGKEKRRVDQDDAESIKRHKDEATTTAIDMMCTTMQSVVNKIGDIQGLMKTNGIE